MATLSDATAAGAVELVIQSRIGDDGAQVYNAWQARVGQILESQPGFLGQQVFAPNPPAQDDWIVIQRFASVAEARAWMGSARLAEALAEVQHLFVGKDDVFLRTEVAAKALEVSALISCRVNPEHEADFLAWEHEMFKAEASAPGFVGHRLNRPVPGLQENWVIVLTFDSATNLDRWLESPRRAELLEAGSHYQSDLQIRKGAYGFGFWFRDEQAAAIPPMVVFKNNLLVLLVLYPIVYLWGLMVGGPILDRLGVPFWLALFIGNLFSTQITGWWAVPWVFGKFTEWLKPDCSSDQNARGFAMVLLGFALSMAAYAYLLTLPKLELW